MQCGRVGLGLPVEMSLPNIRRWQRHACVQSAVREQDGKGVTFHPFRSRRGAIHAWWMQRGGRRRRWRVLSTVTKREAAADGGGNTRAKRAEWLT